jgi:23S rRNA (cytosine1962-C5)-methyltransferase
MRVFWSLACVGAFIIESNAFSSLCITKTNFCQIGGAIRKIEPSKMKNQPEKFVHERQPFNLLIRGSSSADTKATSPQNKNIAVHVTRSVETSLRKRHPWVFENEITKVSREGAAGDIAIVFDNKNEFLAAGLFDPHGPIRIRVLQHIQPKRINDELIDQLVMSSIRRREGIIPPDTDGYRIINGDNDGVPGIVADRYADTIVIKIYSACWAPWLSAVEASLARHAPPHIRRVLLLSRQLQRLDPAVLRGMQHGLVLHGPPLDGSIVFRECGLLFEADPVRGQKTGFFLDQRDNRRRVEALARGARVLNVFSYTGGFSLYAARGGATRVTSVDVSQPALDAAERNFALNRPVDAAVRRAAHQGLAGDAFEVMRQLVEEGHKYSLVIVDPPSMANKAEQRQLAITRHAPCLPGPTRSVAPARPPMQCPPSPPSRVRLGKVAQR